MSIIIIDKKAQTSINLDLEANVQSLCAITSNELN